MYWPPTHWPGSMTDMDALLEAMLEQNSLFYWQGPQTKLLTERFQQICPLPHVQTCSSGTAPPSRTEPFHADCRCWNSTVSERAEELPPAGWLRLNL